MRITLLALGSRLAAAIERMMTDPGMKKRAADLGARIRKEDGVAVAVREIEEKNQA